VGYHKESSGLGGDPETGPQPKLGADLASKRSLNDAPKKQATACEHDYSGGHAGIFCAQHAAILKHAGDEWRFIYFVARKPADYTAGGLVNLLRVRTFAPSPKILS
jgi:hypothetical protein